MSEDTLPCWVYKNERHPDLYVYLAEEDGFHQLPAALRQRLGALQLVMRLELNPDRRLAREDAAEVMASLRSRGFHLQLPPNLSPALFAREASTGHA